MSFQFFEYVILAAMVNIFGGVIIFFKKRWSEKGLNALMAISAGLLLSITILDIIPEVIEVNTYSPIFILLGFLVLFILHQYSRSEINDGKGTLNHSKTTIKGTMFGMIVHTFIDGFSISTGFELDFNVGLTIFIAIILHKLPDGFTISSLIFSLSNNRKKAITASILLGLSTIIGGIVGLVFTQFYIPNEGVIAIILSFTAGILLYVSASEIIPEVSEKRDKSTSWFVSLGILIYYLLIIMLNQL